MEDIIPDEDNEDSDRPFLSDGELSVPIGLNEEEVNDVANDFNNDNENLPEVPHVANDGDDPGGDEEITDSLADVLAKIYSVKLKHEVSDLGFYEIWEIIKEKIELLHFHRDLLPGGRTLKRRMEGQVPDMTLDVCHRNLTTEELIVETDLSKYPRAKYSNRELWELIYEKWKVKVKDVLDFHKQRHEEVIKKVSINVDGVPLGRTGYSQVIMSLMFNNCRSVYPILNIIPRKEKKIVTTKMILEDALKELKELNIEIEYFVCDAPMRSWIRKQLGHSAKKACDYCTAEAVTHAKRRCWALNTLGRPRRTMNQLFRLFQDLEENVPHAQRSLKEYGYKEKSTILSVFPTFDLITKVPVDPMHLLYLGVTRCLVELTFDVGEKRQVTNSMVLLHPDIIKRQIESVKVPKEITRKPRAINFKNFKAAEFKNYILVYFVIITEVIPNPVIKRIWIILAYLCRAFSVDNDAFEKIPSIRLKALMSQWYKLYYKAFGPTNMRYNIHLMSHLECIRRVGPFHEISAFPYESSFAEATKAQVVGSTSEGKQSMKHMYGRLAVGHTCSKTLNINCQETSKKQDNLLYFNDCHGFHFFKVVKVMTPEVVRTQQIFTNPFKPYSDLSFESVGVQLYESESVETYDMNINSFRGKACLVPYGTSEYVIVALSKSFLREGN